MSAMGIFSNTKRFKDHTVVSFKIIQLIFRIRLTGRDGIAETYFQLFHLVSNIFTETCLCGVAAAYQVRRDVTGNENISSTG